MDLLFTSLQLHIDANAASAVPNWKTRWLVHEVADVLSWMASSEAPEKVVHFLTESVQELVDASVSADATNSPSGVSNNGVYWRQSAALVLVRKLVEPWEVRTCNIGVQGHDGEDHNAAEIQALQKLLSWTATVVSAMLLNLHTQEAQAEFVISCSAALMGLQVDPALAPPTHPFVVYQGIVRAIKDSVAQLPVTVDGLQVRENALRNLHLVMQSRQFNDEIFVKCRAELVACVEALSGADVQTGADTALRNQQTLIRNLATDIMAFF